MPVEEAAFKLSKYLDQTYHWDLLNHWEEIFLVQMSEVKIYHIKQRSWRLEFPFSELVP